MSKIKKVVGICLALVLVFGSMANVFAYQLDGQPYSGIQVGDTFYSIQYIVNNQNEFSPIFGPASAENVILDFNGNSSRFSDYLSASAANPASTADYDAWAAAHPTAANPAKLVKSDGTIVNVGEEELTVKSAVANEAGTSIFVTFSDNSTATIQKQLTAGTHDYTFEHNGKIYTARNVTWNPPTPSNVSVEKIEFVNYRNLRVTFSDVVDEASATDATNYYFEIVDGNAHYGAVPTLQDSNQLSKIQTTYPGGAEGWWGDDHIVANTVNGKTVVDIYLPEDARFTNIKDNDLGNYPFEDEDAERTLAVKLKTSKTDGFDKKLLIKDTTVNVAVRNVKDSDGDMTINTAVMPMRIFDNVKPELLDVDIVDNPAPSKAQALGAGLPKNLGTFNLVRTNYHLGQMGEKLEFTYSEPVFDAHELDMSDLEFYRDLELYVNGKLVGTTFNGSLDEFMTFDMSAAATYNGSRTVDLDVEKAVLAAYNEILETGKEYEIRFIGVTDLAGNIEVASEHSFKVKFHDEEVSNEKPIDPVVLGVVQVADNMFRVEFNRANVEGTFVIEDPDGEGFGELEADIPLSAEASNGDFYSYVAVPARDHEPAGAIPTDYEQEDVLAYDGQDAIYRNIRVEDVIVKAVNDPLSDKDLLGDDFVPANKMEMVDDILAPVALDPDDVDYDLRGATIDIPVIDIIPWVDDDGDRVDGEIDYEYETYPIAYKYDDELLRFGNEIEEYQENNDHYLPILVSYVDARGAKHEEVVSNYDVRPWDYTGTEPSDLNPGYPDSIRYDINTDILTLDLTEYPELLDEDGKLVAGAEYSVEIPKGYFTDAPKDTTLTYTHEDARFVTNGHDWDVDWTFGGYAYDILNVDDGRDDNDNFMWWRLDAGLGFTSVKQVLDFEVDRAPDPLPEPEYVPQTSKQLINYEEATNTMRIEFTGTIDEETLVDLDNYEFGISDSGEFLTLAEIDDMLDTNTVVEYQMNDDKQFAVFEIPQDMIHEYGPYAFRVSGVAHPDGGTMTPVETVVRLHDNFRPVVVSAEVMGDSQIKLTFNEPIKYFVDTEVIDAHAVANNFLVKVGNARWYVDTAVLPTDEDNDREIILNGAKLPATGNITVEIVEDQNGNILVIDYSPNKNPLKTDIEYDVERP